MKKGLALGKLEIAIPGQARSCTVRHDRHDRPGVVEIGRRTTVCSHCSASPRAPGPVALGAGLRCPRWGCLARLDKQGFWRTRGVTGLEEEGDGDDDGKATESRNKTKAKKRVCWPPLPVPGHPDQAEGHAMPDPNTNTERRARLLFLPRRPVSFRHAPVEMMCAAHDVARSPFAGSKFVCLSGMSSRDMEPFGAWLVAVLTQLQTCS